VIADLARWKDWTVTDRLVEMFKNADAKTQWVRVPIIHYLRVNPNPIAKVKIEELKAVDPQSVRRALAFFELEAAMQTELDEEDADFERQLKELEREKSGEKDKEGQGKEGQGKEGQGKEGQGKTGQGNRGGGAIDEAASPGESPQFEPKKDAGQVDLAGGMTTPSQGVTTRQFVLRPALDSADFSAELVPDLPVDAAEDLDEMLVSIAAVPAVTAEAGVSNRTPPVEPATALAADAGANSPLDSTRSAGLVNASLAESPNWGSQPIAEKNSAQLWWIVGVPVAVNLLLLALSWSILNGTFGRLFC